MGASSGVQAFVGKGQSLNGTTANDVGGHDFVEVRFSHMAIPDGVGVDDDVWAMLALVEASRFVGPDDSVKVMLSKLLLQRFLKLGFSRGIATATWMIRFTGIGTNKNVFSKLRHVSRLQQELRKDDLGNHGCRINAGIGEARGFRASDFVSIGHTGGLCLNTGY